MDSLYLLIPLSVILIGVIMVIFLWAVKSGQFDDLEGPAHSILFEEEEGESNEKPNDEGDGSTVK
mgnify:FL=1